MKQREQDALECFPELCEMLSHAWEVLFSLHLDLVLVGEHHKLLPSEPPPPLFQGRGKLFKWLPDVCWPCLALGFELQRH